MNWRWNDALQLPERALTGGKRITKTLLVQQAMLTKHEQKMLDRIFRLEHFATIQKTSTRILPHIDDEYELQSVIVLRCEMAGTSAAYAETARLLHKCFPNPTIILFDSGNVHCVSVGIPRKSLAEHGAVVVENIEGTGAFDVTDSAWTDFLDTLAFQKLPQDDLLVFLRAFAQRVRLARAIAVVGSYPRCTADNTDTLFALVAQDDALRITERDIAAARKNKDLTLNEAAKLRMKLKDIQKKRGLLAAEIKELCHD